MLGGQGPHHGAHIMVPALVVAALVGSYRLFEYGFDMKLKGAERRDSQRAGPGLNLRRVNGDALDKGLIIFEFLGPEESPVGGAWFITSL